MKNFSKSTVLKFDDVFEIMLGSAAIRRKMVP